MGNNSSKQKVIHKKAKNNICSHQVLASPPKAKYGTPIFCQSNDDNTYNIFLCTTTKQHDYSIRQGIYKYESKLNSWSHLTDYPFDGQYFGNSVVSGNPLIDNNITIFYSSSTFAVYNLIRNKWYTKYGDKDYLKRGGIVVIQEKDEVHFMGHTGYRYDDGKHIIWKSLQDAMEYDVIDEETQIKNPQLIYCPMVHKILCLGGKLLFIHPGTTNERSVARTDDVFDPEREVKEKGHFRTTNKIWKLDVRGDYQDGWKLCKSELPFYTRFQAHFIIGFGHILFVFYYEHKYENGKIWCMDLLNGRKYKLEWMLPKTHNSRVIKIENEERVNVIYYRERRNGFSVEHISIDLRDLLPGKLVRLYGTEMRLLIEGMGRELGVDVMTDVTLMIAGFISRLCLL